MKLEKSTANAAINASSTKIRTIGGQEPDGRLPLERDRDEKRRAGQNATDERQHQREARVLPADELPPPAPGCASSV